MIRIEHNLAGDVHLTDVEVFQREKKTEKIIYFYISKWEQSVTIAPSEKYLPIKYSFPEELISEKTYVLRLFGDVELDNEETMIIENEFIGGFTANIPKELEQELEVCLYDKKDSDKEIIIEKDNATYFTSQAGEYSLCLKKGKTKVYCQDISISENAITNINLFYKKYFAPFSECVLFVNNELRHSGKELIAVSDSKDAKVKIIIPQYSDYKKQELFSQEYEEYKLELFRDYRKKIKYGIGLIPDHDAEFHGIKLPVFYSPGYKKFVGLDINPFFAGNSLSIDVEDKGDFTGVAIGGAGVLSSRFKGIGISTNGVLAGEFTGMAIGNIAVGGNEFHGFALSGVVLDFYLGDIHGVAIGGIHQIGLHSGFYTNDQEPFIFHTVLLGLFSGSISQNCYGVSIANWNVNTDTVVGVQIGVINYTKKLKGVQIGVINIVKDGKGGALPFFPIINVHF
ncbi:MAG: hypothetical protein K9M99_06350 [Candidatus Cloacimonetes bacterium]|nr:hypothetical protein [Candidatus Cloacimonadota bacterium]